MNEVLGMKNNKHTIDNCDKVERLGFELDSDHFRIRFD